jgi:predicted O-linked N-acetylglucosamine transferase (SPINDLY family)
MAPQQLRTLIEQALRHHGAGRLKEAEALYARARAAAPTNFDAVHLSGTLALQQGRHGDAAALLRRALRLGPSSAPCEMRLGVALAALGDRAAALGHLQASAARAPAVPETWCHLGLVQRALGQVAEARISLERSVSVKPDYADALEHLGGLVSAAEGFAAAVPILRRVAALRPDDPAALANLGIALAQSGGQAEALALLDRALERDPSSALALTGRAFVLQEQFRLDEAVEAYGSAIRHNPANHEARSCRLLTLHYLDGISRAELHAEHAAFGAAMPEAPRAEPANTPDPLRRLRVGFLSPDLRAHSVAYFLEPLLAHLDPAQFEVVLYHDHARVDAVSTRLRGNAALWRHVAGQPHAAVEMAVRADAPDILVDLAGHTGHNRLPLFARRLAPVQVTYLGYPNTTGLREMDFRLVDSITDPEGDADPYHSEKLLRFAPTAWCYAPPDSAPAPARACGGPIVFGCFNNFAKVSEVTLLCWSSLLAAVPESRLLIKGHGLDVPAIAERLRQRFAHGGIDAGRVDLAGRTPGLAAHLGCYSRVDVALDTFPYHGTTTTCEALWMGVPVVTRVGDRHASRVGASLLCAAGHPEWAARDPEDYVRIAAGLARDAGLRAALRTGLRDDLRRGPLLDHGGQSARFGAALRTAWQAWCAGRSPAVAGDGPISLNMAVAEPMGFRNHGITALSA